MVGTQFVVLPLECAFLAAEVGDLFVEFFAFGFEGFGGGVEAAKD